MMHKKNNSCTGKCYDSIRPGQIWLDTNGNRIQAHGGSVIYIDDTYYFYGENKEKTDGINGIHHWGVRCYASQDLYNWEDKGLIIPPELDDSNSSLHPRNVSERPHIIYNKETKKYVAWIKNINRDGTQSETILTADCFLGPYTKIKQGFRPLNMSAGDFDLSVAPDGKAYYYFERVHNETICADLTSDYTDVTGYYSTHFTRPYPPYVREATTHFVRRSKHYLITSGTTGYFPNPSEIAVGNSWHGPFTIIGNLHPYDTTDTSYHSQISSVFKVQGKKDLYIACADRWLPQHTHFHYNEYSQYYEALFNPDSKKKIEEFGGKFDLGICNTAISDYVWLPLKFEDASEENPFGRVYIEWKDEWKIEDYE